MDDVKFAEIQPNIIAYIVAMEINEHIVTGKEEAVIRDLLDVTIRTNAELRAVRNTLVREYADARTIARAMGDWGTFDRLTTAMSASTAVIDGELYRRGAYYER